MDNKRFYKKLMAGAFASLSVMIPKDDFENFKNEIENIKSEDYKPVNKMGYDLDLFY